MRAVRVEVIGQEKRVWPCYKMRTTLQETPTAKSMQVNDKNILLLPNFDLSKMSHSESEFYYSGKLSYAEKLQSPIHSDSKERNLTLLATEDAHNFLRSQQANRRSRKQLFWINCPIINIWSNQTVLTRNFFPWKAWKNSSWVKSKKTEDENKARYECFLRIYRVSGISCLHQKNHKHTLYALG